MKTRVGRILAVEARIARVRFPDEDVQLVADAEWQPGDLIAEEEKALSKLNTQLKAEERWLELEILREEIDSQ